MPDSVDKWNQHTKGGEVAQGLLEARLGNTELYNAIIALVRDDRSKAVESLQRYLEHDDKLRELIDKIGGLNAYRKPADAA